MNQLNKMNCDCHSEIDRMINEGLGGGFIIHEYDVNKYERVKKETDRDH